MGAGAGYTIETSNVRLNGDVKIYSFDVTQDGGWLVASVDCMLPIIGSIKANSYMYGCDWVEDVAMYVKHISINFLKSVEYSEVTEELIKEVLTNTANYDGSGLYGGGWIHSKFDGEFELTTFPNSYSDDINSVTIFIDNDLITEFIDLAVLGDNIEYSVFYNDDIIEVFSDESEAIAYLKQEINYAIDEGDVDSIRWDECYVEYRYWYYLNGEGESDVDYATDDAIVYTADGDDDYAAYI